jgi:hypothetical protein
MCLFIYLANNIFNNGNIKEESSNKKKDKSAIQEREGAQEGAQSA